LPDARDRTAAPQTFVNQLDEATIDGAGRFGGPQSVGDAGDATPGIDVDRTDTVLGFSSAGRAQLAFAPTLPGPFAILGQQPALAGPAPVVAAGLSGRTVLASAGDGGGGEVIVRELRGTQLAQSEPVSSNPGGPIRELAIAGSGRGDALVAFAQGVDGDRQIAVSVVDAAPRRRSTGAGSGARGRGPCACARARSTRDATSSRWLRRMQKASRRAPIPATTGWTARRRSSS